MSSPSSIIGEASDTASASTRGPGLAKTSSAKGKATRSQTTADRMGAMKLGLETHERLEIEVLQKDFDNNAIRKETKGKGPAPAPQEVVTKPPAQNHDYNDDDNGRASASNASVGIQRRTEIGNARCDPPTLQANVLRIEELASIPLQGRLTEWTRIGRGLRKGGSSKYVKEDETGTMVLQAEGTLTRVSFVDASILCAPPFSSTVSKHGEIRHYSTLGILLRDDTLMPQFVCDDVIIQGLDRTGIDRRLARSETSKATERTMYDHYVRIGLPRHGFEYIMRWISHQLIDFEVRPSVSEGYYWHSAGTGGEANKMGTTYRNPGGKLEETQDLTSFMERVGFCSLKGKATISLSLAFANRFDNSSMENMPNDEVGKLSIRMHHMLVSDYGSWAGPVQVLPIASVGTGVGTVEAMPLVVNEACARMNNSPCIACSADIRPWIKCLGVPNPNGKNLPGSDTAEYVNIHADWEECLGKRVAAGAGKQTFKFIVKAAGNDDRIGVPCSWCSTPIEIGVDIISTWAATNGKAPLHARTCAKASFLDFTKQSQDSMRPKNAPEGAVYTADIDYEF